MFDFFNENEHAPKDSGSISTDQALELGREILSVLNLKYGAQDGIGGMVGALAICCAEGKLQDDKTRDGALTAIHNSLDQCFRRVSLGR